MAGDRNTSMHQSLSASQRAGAPRLFGLRVALLFCAPLMVNGIGLPYFPVFLDYLGMSDAEIGIILAMPHLLRMIGTPLGSWAADRAPDRVHVLVWSSVVSLITALALCFSQSFWAVLIIYGLQGIAYAPYVPVAEAILVTGVRRWGFDYGVIRLWGSAAFILTNLIGGWLFAIAGGGMVAPAMAVFFVLTIVMALTAPRLGRAGFRASAAGDAAPMAGPSPFLKPYFILVVGGAALSQGSHAMLFTFASIYWAKQGYSGEAISLFWAAGVVAEILMFWLSARFLSRISLWGLILFGCGVAVLRWIIFPMELGFWGHLGLQCAHAFTFATAHIGIQRFLIANVDESREASAQGYYTTMIALFMALGTWVSGYLYNAFGVHGFYAMSVAAGLGFVMVLWARFLQPQSAGAGGVTVEPS